MKERDDIYGGWVGRKPSIDDWGRGTNVTKIGTSAKTDDSWLIQSGGPSLDFISRKRCNGGYGGGGEKRN